MSAGFARTYVAADALAPEMRIVVGEGHYDGDGIGDYLVDVQSVAYDLTDGAIVAGITYPDGSVDDFEFYVDETVPVYRPTVTPTAGPDRGEHR